MKKEKERKIYRKEKVNKRANDINIYIYQGTLKKRENREEKRKEKRGEKREKKKRRKEK